MSELTPLLGLPYPSEFEENYFATIKGFFLANDAAVWALSENDNLIWSGGGIFAWSATTSDLVWSLPVDIRTKTTPFKVTIPGPPSPGGIVHLNDGEVAFFQEPRLLVSNQVVSVPLTVSPITVLPGVRLHDIRIFACRIGTTIFFANGKSIKDGESGVIFGGGIGNTIQPHEHQPALVIEPVSAGVTQLDMDIASFSPALLKKVYLFRNGQLLSTPADYTVVLATGIVTLVTATISGSERFVALRETSPPVVTTGQHVHLADRIIEPIPATFLLDMLVTSLDYPALTRIELFRNGAILAEPADYSLSLITGLATLITPSIAGERFLAHREVQY